MRKVKVNEFKATATLFELILDEYDEESGRSQYVVECKTSPTIMHLGNGPVDDRDLRQMLLDFVGTSR